MIFKGLFTEKKLLSTANFIFFAIFIYLFVSNTFFNSHDLIHYNMAKAIFVAIFSFGAMYLLFLRPKSKIKQLINENFDRYFKWYMLILFLLQLIMVYFIYCDFPWDPSMIFTSAVEMSENGFKVTNEYFAIYKNNILFLHIMSGFFKIARMVGIGNFQFFACLLSLIVVDISLIIMKKCMDGLFEKNIIFLSILIFTALIALSPSGIVPYTDTFTIIFPIGQIYFYKRYCSDEKIKYLIFSGVVGAFGYFIKPTAVISLIAVVILLSIKKGGIKKSAVLLITFCISFFSLTCLVNSVELPKTKETPFGITHYFMLGMNTRYIEDRGILYGAFSPVDFTVSYQIKDTDKRIEENLKVIKTRFKDYGVGGYIEFLLRKASWIISDGNFYWEGEGAGNGKSVNESPPAQVFQKYLRFNGTGYNKYALIIQGIWTLMLSMIVLPLALTSREKQIKGVNMALKISAIGIILFLLMFEARSRYLINHLPILIMLCGYGLQEAGGFVTQMLTYCKNLKKGV